MLVIGGCGSSGGDDPINCPGDPGCPKPSNVNFNGNWDIHEDLEGCNDTLEKDYPIVIKQNENNATLEVAEQNYIDCTVVDDKLQCEGDLRLENDGYLDYSEYTLWYNGDDLEGEGSWTLYDAHNNSCSGTSLFSATSGSPPDDDIPDFSGEWEIYEEQEGDNHYTQYRYTVTIDQNGTQATIYKDNEHMTCNVVGEELNCEGGFFYEEDSNNCTFDSYTLRHDGNNGLTGEASWSCSFYGNYYTGRSNLTTTRPEEGSIRIRNQSDQTLPLVVFRLCGSDKWSENQTSNPIGPMVIWTLYSVQPGCYDVIACEDVEVTRNTRCASWEDVTVNGGETSRLGIRPNSLRLNQSSGETSGSGINPNSLRLNQSSVDTERFSGSVDHALKDPIR
jgi:hypothetical protein